MFAINNYYCYLYTMARLKGSKHKSTIVFNEIKERVIQSGMYSESDRLRHLKVTDPYLYAKVVSKLFKL